MNKVESLFLSQLRLLFSEKAGEDICTESLSKEELSEILRMSAEHSVTPVLTEAMFKSGLLTGEAAEVYRQMSFISFMKWQKQETELNKITAVFENAGIDHIPLKGAVIRKFYPEPFMRTSCDIDILIHEDKLNEAEKLLVEHLGYVRKGKTSHDVMLSSPDGVNFELHYDFDEEAMSLPEIWETAVLSVGNHQYMLSAEWFILHHMAHMAKHFTIGGCGVRTLIDLYLIQSNMPCNKELLFEMLKQNNLQAFAEKIMCVVEKWFEVRPFDEFESTLMLYILRGGSYGNITNRAAVIQRKKQHNAVRLFFARVFLSFDTLKPMYPVLKNRPFLYPFCQVHRWFKVCKIRKFKAVGSEIEAAQGVDEELREEVKMIFQELGL